jgi:hypothetical protein
MQMATMMGQSKPSVVLTDQTDLGDKMSELTDKMVQTISGLKGSNIDDLGVVNALKDGVDSIKQIHQASGKDHSKHLQSIHAAIKSQTLKMQPNVTVSSAPVDFQPLLDAMQSDDDDAIDFDDYKASDINNDDDNMQYVGFLSPDGCWYIIENDIKGNSMRYVFGEGDYAKAWKKASSYKYKLLNEAVTDYKGTTEEDDAEA